MIRWLEESQLAAALVYTPIGVLIGVLFASWWRF